MRVGGCGKGSCGWVDVGRGRAGFRVNEAGGRGVRVNELGGRGFRVNELEGGGLMNEEVGVWLMTRVMVMVIVTGIRKECLRACSWQGQVGVAGRGAGHAVGRAG